MRETIWSFWFVLAAFGIAQPPTFDAASIKPSKEDFGHSGWHSRPGIIMLTGQTLSGLICIAYHVKDVQVSGGPKWVNRDRFDINAKADGPASDAQLLAMLQTLLMERFQLTFHKEEKIASSYALVVPKSGLKIKASDGTVGSHSSGSKGRISAQGVTMAKLADLLARQVGEPVANLTGMAGVYDFTLEWSTEGDSADNMSELLAALQQHLGLKLERRKLPLELMVIDRAESLPKTSRGEFQQSRTEFPWRCPPVALLGL